MKTAARLTLGVMMLCCTCEDVSAQARAIPRAKVAFPAGRTVIEVPFELDQGFIVIAVRVNESKPLRFVLDSGAPVMVLPDEDLAETLDLQIWMQAQVAGTGDGPLQTAPLAGGVKARVGELHISNAMMVLGVAGEALPGLDGVIGSSIFENTVVEIDWTARRLELHDPESYSYAGSGEILPLKLMPSGHPYVPAAVNIDGSKWVSVNLAVDTGARGALALSIDRHDQLNKPSRVIETILGWGSRGAARGSFGRVSGVRFGQHHFENVVTGFPPGLAAPGGSEKHGVMGIQILERFSVIFDRPHERLILDPGIRFSDAFEFSTTGLRFRPWPRGAASLTVADVIAGSPAQDAGIQVGDEITAINGRRLSSIPARELRDLEQSTPGTELLLTIRRKGTQHDKKLVTRKVL